jgi:hypothetical protein
VAVRVAEMNVGDLTSKDNGQTKLPIVLDEAAVEDILGVILVLFAIYACRFEWISRYSDQAVKAGQLEN